jgi:hypothetical protein
MHARRVPHPSSRAVVVALGMFLVAGLLSVGSASAHTFTKNDGNDTPGLLDLRSASVAHKPTAVVHSFRTFAGWAPSDLGRSSSGFFIGIDKNNDPQHVERCVVVVFRRGRLRAFLTGTDCSNVLGTLPVSKPNRTTVKVTIPKAQTGLSYRWAVISLYFEERPCLNGCFDGIPNLSGFILHDLIPPSVTMDTDPLRVWEADTDATFTFPFTVSDTGGAGVKTWTVQRHPIGSGSWTNVISGTGGGAQSPTIAGTEGTRRNYRVVVTDKHGNRKVGPVRRVYIPIDDDGLDPASFSTAPVSTDDIDAFGGSYSLMSATQVFTYSFTPTGSDCTFELIGPGSGDWTVSVTIDAGAPTVLTPPGGGQRQTLYSDSSCGSVYQFTVNSGDGFAVDAVLG